jgi:hypothetical protein
MCVGCLRASAFSVGSLNMLVCGFSTGILLVPDFFMFDVTIKLLRVFLEENWTNFKVTLIEAMKKHIPQKKISSRWNVPWITTEIKKLIRKKRRAYNVGRHIGLVFFVFFVLVDISVWFSLSFLYW